MATWSTRSSPETASLVDGLASDMASAINCGLQAFDLDAAECDGIAMPGQADMP